VTRATIRSIPNKSQLRHLGNCFRRKDSDGSWKIAAQYYVGEKETNKRFDFGMMPVLALRRRYDKDGDPRFTTSGYHQTLTLPPIAAWQKTTIHDFPKFSRRTTKPEHQNQACFHFKTNDVDVWLPALELARTLFFPSSYLAHLALQPEGLDGSFHTKKLGAGTTEVHMLPGANFPKYYVQREAYRIHLAWLLLNSNIRKSFDSIAANRIARQVVDSKYARWVFDFSPPDLAAAKIHALGQFDQEQKAFLIYEITGLSDVDHQIDDEVHFSDTSSPITGEGGGKPRTGISRPPVDDIELEDEEEASTYNHHFIAPAPHVGLRFKRQLSTKKTGASTRTVGSDGSEDGKGVFPTVGSIAEGSIAGNFPQSDFSQLDADINLAELKEKFALFQKLVDLLVVAEELDIVLSEIRPLPELPRYRTHLMANGALRHYMHVVVRLSDGRFRHILEVDTTDGKTALATKILEFAPGLDDDDALRSILTLLIKGSLRWPSETLDNTCNQNRSVPHPKCKAVGYIEQDELLHWSHRIKHWLTAKK